ncbi:hypothetical protein [Sphingomonas faeni]|uniref:hypothetical protein n=1 Tax=Sphingomonas faeni TaxID=185950 RepID=UPI0033613C12
MVVCKWLVTVAALMLSACGSALPDYRYKMTVHIVAPDGDRAYSSVRGIHSEYVSSMMSSSGRTIKDTFQGEAIIIDLPSGRTVYALLSRPDDPDYATYVTGPALGPHIPRANGGDVSLTSAKGAFLTEIVSRREAMLALKGVYNLPRTVNHNPSHRDDYKPEPMWPLFVTFDDPARPASVREVSPESIGVKQITIEITDEPVTELVQQKLPWLADYGRKHGSLIPNPPRYLEDSTLIQRVSPTDFSSELYK